MNPARTETGQGLTERLAHFASAPQALTISASVRNTVRNGFIDTVAVMLAGRDEPVTGIVQAFAAGRQADPGQARVLLGPQRATARDAALINATAGHAMDYDDVALQGHPSVVLVPVLLAEGERLHAAGEALLRAYVIGYEVWAELLRRDPDLHHLKGWHPTGVFGVLAAAAASAALRGLSAQTTRHALGLAASMAAGLTANFGSMAKPFHAGQAAAHGIDAVDLACAGMTAAPDVLEHAGGFLAAFSPKGRVERGPPADDFGQRLVIAQAGLTVKKYPLCFAAHRIVDAALDLVAQHRLRPQDVRAIEATVGLAQATMLRNHRPQLPLEAKFSLEFAIAAALVAGRVGLRELQAAFVRSPDVQQLLPRVQIATTDTVCEREPTLALSDRLVIHTHDGRRLDSGEVQGVRGDPQTPMAANELRSKFMDCLVGTPDVDADRLFGQLERLDSHEDVATLGW